MPVGQNAGSVFPGGIDSGLNAAYDPNLGPAVSAMQFVQGCFPPEALLNVIAQSIPDTEAFSTVTLTAGTVFQTLIGLRGGTTVTNLSLITAGTATSTPTNQWAGLAYPGMAPAADVTSKVVAISADGLTTAMAANTLLTYAMSTPYVVPLTAWYLAFFCVAGTTGPTAAAGTTIGSTGRGALEGWITGPGDTGKTVPYAIGATIGEMTAASAQLLIYAN